MRLLRWKITRSNTSAGASGYQDQLRRPVIQSPHAGTVPRSRACGKNAVGLLPAARSANASLFPVHHKDSTDRRICTWSAASIAATSTIPRVNRPAAFAKWEDSHASCYDLLAVVGLTATRFPPDRK